VPEVRPDSPFLVAIGGQVREQDRGQVRLSLPLASHHTNPLGVMHGGVVATLLDEAAALAVSSALGVAPGQPPPHLLVEMNVSFLSAARPGQTLEVEGRVLRLGRRVAFAESEARCGGTLVAKGRFTFVLRHA